MAAKKQPEENTITITPPNMQRMTLYIRGTAPLVIARFSKKAELMAKMAEGPSAKNKKNREARDYEKEAQDAKHISTDGWEGVAATSFRNACIAACRLVGFKMTVAKMSVFIDEDGYSEDNKPLVRIWGDGSETYTDHTRNATGVADVRSRPMYKRWGCVLRIKHDADQISAQSVVNLVARAGAQCGVGEGRPFSKDSAGLGYGVFDVVQGEEVAKFRDEFGIK